ncbi:MAG: FTR1 family protein [Candidatus Limnocylindria bacterium]
MDLGFGTTGLLTGLREGVEAALIVSIILAYLAKTGNAGHFGRIWLGTSAAIAVSIVAGGLLFVTIRGLEAPAEQIFEGSAMVIAAGLLSHAAHEYVGAGWITVGTGTAFDISGFLPHDPEAGFGGVVGSILRALFGYSSSPEWATLVTWIAYVATVLPLYLRPIRPAGATARPAEQRPAST